MVQKLAKNKQRTANVLYKKICCCCYSQIFQLSLTTVKAVIVNMMLTACEMADEVSAETQAINSCAWEDWAHAARFSTAGSTVEFRDCLSASSTSLLLIKLFSCTIHTLQVIYNTMCVFISH